MLFSTVVGQSFLKHQLCSTVQQERTPHAIMLSGKVGAGVLPMALAFAQYLMCENPSATDACGNCANCYKVNILQHPDVHFSFPCIKLKPTDRGFSDDFVLPFRNFVKQNAYGNINEWLENIGAENKQGNITAAECRHMIGKLNLKSNEGGIKIMIMWLPEYLGGEGNILLKLIEEPPPKTVLIFATENYDNIIATIQSRTQLFSLAPLADIDIKNALLALNINEPAAIKIARTAEGNYNEALKLMGNTNEHDFDLLRDWLNALFTNNTARIVSLAFNFADLGRENQKQFLSYFITIFEHLLRLQHVSDAQLLLQPEEAELVNKLSKTKLTSKKISGIAAIINAAIYHIERNANAKITFTGVSNKIFKVLQESNVLV
jgi:DNA polymerase III subunit delta'